YIFSSNSLGKPLTTISSAIQTLHVIYTNIFKPTINGIYYYFPSKCCSTLIAELVAWLYIHLAAASASWARIASNNDLCSKLDFSMRFSDLKKPWALNGASRFLKNIAKSLIILFLAL